MDSDRAGIPIDREALGEAVEATVALLALVDAAPRLPSEDPLDFVRALRQSAEADGD